MSCLVNKLRDETDEKQTYRVLIAVPLPALCRSYICYRETAVLGPVTPSHIIHLTA